MGFSLVRVLITLRCCHLQVDNMDQVMTIVKKAQKCACIILRLLVSFSLCNSMKCRQPNEPHANCKPNSYFKRYLKIEELLTRDKHNLIEKHGFLKNYKLVVTNFVGQGGFVWRMVGSRNLCYNWAKFFVELGFNSPTSFVLVLLVVQVLCCNFFLQAIKLKIDMHHVCAYPSFFEN